MVAEHDRFRRDGDNLETVVTLPMTAAALGTSIDVKTLEAEWEGSEEADRKVTVEVPAGMQSGARIPLKGRGVPRLRGGGRGELGVTFVVETPRNWMTGSVICCVSSRNCGTRPRSRPSTPVTRGSGAGSRRPSGERCAFLAEIGQAGIGGVVEVTGDEARHAVTVKRTRVGESVLLSDGAGRAVRGCITSTGKDRFSVEVTEILGSPANPIGSWWCRHYAKGDRSELRGSRS